MNYTISWYNFIIIIRYYFAVAYTIVLTFFWQEIQDH